MSEHLSTDELSYLHVVRGQRQAADAAWDSYAMYLRGKYQLTEEDVIAEDGTIERAKAIPFFGPINGVDDDPPAEFVAPELPRQACNRCLGMGRGCPDCAAKNGLLALVGREA